MQVKSISPAAYGYTQKSSNQKQKNNPSFTATVNLIENSFSGCTFEKIILREFKNNIVPALKKMDDNLDITIKGYSQNKPIFFKDYLTLEGAEIFVKFKNYVKEFKNLIACDDLLHIMPESLRERLIKDKRIANKEFKDCGVVFDATYLSYEEKKQPGIYAQKTINLIKDFSEKSYIGRDSILARNVTVDNWHPPKYVNNDVIVYPWY